MRQETTQLVIYYPNGSTQVIKPQEGFKGNWQALAEGIAGVHYPRGEKVKYELR